MFEMTKGGVSVYGKFENYKVTPVSKSIKLNSEIINGDNSGRLQSTKEMFMDYVGTFFNYDAQFVRDNDCTDDEWWQFFLECSNPINSHAIKMPFGNGIMTERVYISSVSIGYINDKNGWQKALNVRFIATNSRWLAGDTLKGYSEK